MSHDPLAGLLRSFCLTTMAAIYADTLQQAEQHHWGYRKFLQHPCSPLGCQAAGKVTLSPLCAES